MDDKTDPYWKLRPPPPTPAEELCSCTDGPPVMLQARLSSNPLACLCCNLEVPPERIGFPLELAEELARWQSFFDCFFLLWLDSGEFEAWAKAQLDDPASPVNVRALEVTARLNQFRRAYYRWFQDTGTEDFEPLLRCPRCQRALAEWDGRLVCDQCSIVVAN